jgi:urease accessory protein
MRMRKQHGYRHGLGSLTVIALTLLLAAALPAEAHHVMGGKTPATLLEGFLSGLGHPIIGIDHLAFIAAVGLAAGMAGLHLTMPFLFIVASALGVALHVRGVNLPVSEFIVAASVLLAGVLIARGVVVHTVIWLALFAVAGLFHGYAYGESIVGAEPEPLSAYLAGLVVVQAALATGIAIFARRSGEGALTPRLVGAAIAGIGLAALAGQIVPV